MVEKINTTTDVVCPFCGCLCDDIEVYVDSKENKIVETANACVLGTAKFMSANDVSHRITTPMIRENGKVIAFTGNGHIVNKYGIPDRTVKRHPISMVTIMPYALHGTEKIDNGMADYIWLTPSYRQGLI